MSAEEPEIRATLDSRASKPSSLAKGILFWMMLVAMVPLVIMASQGYHCARQAVVDIEFAHLHAVLASRKARIDDWLMERKSDLAALAGYPSACRNSLDSLSPMTAYQAKAYSDLLNYTRARCSSFRAIQVFDASWNCVVSSPSTTNGNGDLIPAEFKAILANPSREPAIWPHLHDDGIMEVHMGSSVTNAGQSKIGYVVAAVSFSGTARSVLNDRTGLQNTGKLRLLPIEKPVVNDIEPRNSTSSAMSMGAMCLPSGDQKSVSIYPDDRGVRVLGVGAPMPELGWNLVVEIDEAEAFGWLRTLRLRALGTGLVTLMGVLLLASRSARQIIRPLRRLSDTARRIATGHGQERVAQLNVLEAQEVGAAFNAMLDELDRMNKQIAQTASLSAIGQLSSSIVHEMRNPLSSVKMNLKALQERVGGDPVHGELAEIAASQVSRIEKMLSDLLQFGKPLELTITPVSFQRLAADVKTSLAPKAADKGIVIEIPDYSGDNNFNADYEQLQRALFNLVHNAVEITPNNGSVTIAGAFVEEHGRKFEISVADTGPGVPDGIKGKLFQPFCTSRDNGTGLGLANVKKIADLHGGTVSFENKAGGGAVFRIALPVNR